MTAYADLRTTLAATPRTWLVTGCAGFIGSNLLEALLRLGQNVVGLDNFSTGYQSNLDEVRGLVGEAAWGNFRFIEGDIRHPATCDDALAGVDYVLHQAALGSVPRSIDDPWNTHDTILNGFMRMLIAARDAGVRRFVYAASSSTYGDHPGLPKVEHTIGKPLSPYAVTKYVNELYAEVFVRTYGIQAVGLRYFNVFGPRQNPNGAYAAVMPKWFASLLEGEPVYINGDGETSRDFCFIQNVIQANLLAATVDTLPAFGNAVEANALAIEGEFRPPVHEVFNVAVGDRTSLNQLFAAIRDEVARIRPALAEVEPLYRDFRVGDVQHSLADISKAQTLLGYAPTWRVAEGLKEAGPWYARYFGAVA